MSAQYHNGHWYGGGQDIDIQSDPTATSFESGKVPTGDTIQGVYKVESSAVTTSAAVTNIVTNRIKRFANSVCLDLRCTIKPSSVGWALLGTIDDPNMRPSETFDIIAADNNSTNSAKTCQVRIANTGEIMVYQFVANTSLITYIHTSYVR